jgi:predicted dehydrogenase
MAADAVQIGLIGAGFMGRRHADLIAADPDTRLVGVADPMSSSVADAHGVPAYRTQTELLTAGGVDAVVIANPNALHVDTAIEALTAGVAVLLEKPIAVDYPESLRLVAAVDDLGGRLLVGQHRRHHPSIAAARGVLASGRLGALVAVSGMWAARKHDAYFDEPWHRSKGAGVMLINLVHDLDLLRYLCGEVRSIQAIVSSHTRALEVEDTVAVNLEFVSGALGSFLATDAAASPWGWDQATTDADDFPYIPQSPAYFLAGTEGSLSVPDLARFSYEGGAEGEWRRPLSRTFVPSDLGDSYSRQLRHFVDVVRGADPIVSALDASHTLALIEAAHFAAETNDTIDLETFQNAAITASA